MQRKVLIVDDMEINREILTEILQDEYSIITAENGRQALDVLSEFREEIKIVLLDLVMPEMDGFAVLQTMQERAMLGLIPVLVITGEDSVETERRCFDYGVSDFIKKPFDFALVQRRVRNVVELFLHKNELEHLVDVQTDKLKAQNKLLQEQKEKLEQNNEKIIEVLGTVVEYRNLESGMHIQRVKSFTKIMAEYIKREYPEYGLTNHQVDVIVSASALHDVGKICIPDSVLLKPGRLTAEEFECMKSHTTKGSEIIDDIDDAWDEEYMRASYEIVRHHHERYGGKGYPDGLAGEDIPISAQIVSIADVYDALVTERVYKKAFSKEETFRMIMAGECGEFSPKLLHCFEIARPEFEEMADKLK